MFNYFLLFLQNKIKDMQDTGKESSSANRPKPKAFYQQKKEETVAAIEQLRTTSRRQSLLRVVFFLASIVSVYVLVKPQPVLSGIVAALFFGLFIYTARRHQRTQRKIKRSEMLNALTANELKALEGDYSKFSNGLSYLDKSHPFAHDLDIFGEGSLFQRMDRSFSDRGSELLAQRLTNPFKESITIRKVQEGVKELAGKPEWMLNYRTTGNLMPADIDESKLIAFFAHTYPQFRKPIIKTLLFLMPVLTLLMLVLTIAGTITFGMFIIYVLMVPIGITAYHFNTISQIHNNLGKQAGKLQQYRKLLEYLEGEGWISDEMNSFHHRTQTGGKEASAIIGSLIAILERFDYRLNLIAGILLNILFLWDIRMVRQLEFWKEKNANHVEDWLRVLNEVEYLISQASFAFNHPDYIFPEIANDDLVEAENAGHPFINPGKRVGNPIEFKHWDEFKVITGGNMAGKSTYLRTVGINLVLAMTGNPVCAKRFRFMPMTIITSIRSDDSLQENESLFYAELKKLRDIIQRLESGEALFLLLDEILKGTNSEDKQKGSLALLRQLLRYKTSGAIATHDLAVGNLEKEFPGSIQNLCFEIEIKDRALRFDYRLREGMAKNLNATFLMKQMGITIDEE